MVAALSCPQCGAVVEMPPERAAGACAFCRTPLVAAVADGDRADFVAPFEVSRAQAAERLRQHLRARVWAPGDVRRLDPDRLDGVLVPFLIHDAIARSSYTARVGADYWVTTGFGKNRKRRRETEWFELAGGHVAERRGHLVSGSRGLPEAEANELEPFDLGKLRPFDPALVAGWIAERPTITRDEALKTATSELERVENEAIRRFLPGDHARDVRSVTDLSDVGVRMALLPAWIATFRSGERAMRLLVNGQTGEVVGRVPVSAVKVAVAIVLPLAILGVLALLAAIGGSP